LFLWRLYLMVLRGATSLLGALEGVGPENLDFFGPTPSSAPRNDVAPLKTITFHAIKTTGTLIVSIQQVSQHRNYTNFKVGAPPGLEAVL
jgi:hypothetical protein